MELKDTVNTENEVICDLYNQGYTLRHIVAKSDGGSLTIENLRFISWFENRAKESIPYEKWEQMKKNIKYYL